MNIIFMNSQNSQTSERESPLIKLTDEFEEKQ